MMIQDQMLFQGPNICSPQASNSPSLQTDLRHSSSQSCSARLIFLAAAYADGRHAAFSADHTRTGA